MAGAKLERTRTPGIYRRGSSYTFSFRDGRGRQKWKSAETLTAATRLRDRTRADVSRGKHEESSDAKFSDHATEWLENYQGRTNRGFRETTRKSYRLHLERAANYFEADRGLRFADVTPKDVRGFVTWLTVTNPKMSRGTIERHVATIKAMYADAVADNEIPFNPAREVRVAVGHQLVEPEERRALSREEIRSLMRAVPDEWKLMIEFMLHTGMRIGEVVELRWRDIEFAKRTTVKVRRSYVEGAINAPKGGKAREIPLSKTLAADLWRIQGRLDDLVFTNSVGKRVDKLNALRRMLRPVAVEAGIDWPVGFHSLRHTCASILFAEGRNAVQVQRWLGHFSPDYTLKTYVHLLEDGVGDADFLDGVTGRGEHRGEQTTHSQPETIAA